MKATVKFWVRYLWMSVVLSVRRRADRHDADQCVLQCKTCQENNDMHRCAPMCRYHPHRTLAQMDQQDNCFCTQFRRPQCDRETLD